MAFTKVSPACLSTTASFTLGDVNATGVGTFASLVVNGNVNIAGTITYEDVTNIDSVGLITARSGIHVTGVGSSVGIGTSTPTHLLDVFANQGATIRVRSSDLNTAYSYGILYLGDSSDDKYIIGYGSQHTAQPDAIALKNLQGPIQFHASSGGQDAERVRITRDGNIGIGTTNPQQKLHIVDETSANIYLETKNSGAGSTAGIYFRTSDSTTADAFFKTAIVLEDDGTAYARGKLHVLQENTADESNASISDSVVTIDQSGRVGIGTTRPLYNTHINFVDSTTDLSGGNDGEWGGQGIRIENDDKTPGSMSLVHFRTGNNADWHVGTKFYGTADSDFVMLEEGVERLRISQSGRVGIGSTMPTESDLTLCDNPYGLFHFANDSLISTYMHTTPRTYARLNLDGGGVGSNAIGDKNTDHYLISYGTSSTYNTGLFAMKSNTTQGIEFHTGSSTARRINLAGDGKLRFSHNNTIPVASADPLDFDQETDVPLYITLTAQASAEAAAGAASDAFIRIKDTGSTNSRFFGLEMRNRNNGDARIINEDTATSNVCNLLFMVDNGTEPETRLKIFGSGSTIFYSGVNGNKYLQLQGDGSKTNGPVYRLAFAGDGATSNQANMYRIDFWEGTYNNTDAANAFIQYDASTGRGGDGAIVLGGSTTAGSNTSIADFARDRSVHIYGALSKASGSFRIPHPLAGLSTTKELLHSFIEGPQCDNIYRGKTTLVSGISTVNIDSVSGMTEGTFAVLNRDIQCFTSNETGWTAVKGSVNGNLLTIVAQDNTCTDTISWMVVGERQDPNIRESTITDDEGRLLVEVDILPAHIRDTFGGE